MEDTISKDTSTAAFIEITDEVLSICSQCITLYKDVPKAIPRVINEASSLKALLEDLKGITTARGVTAGPKLPALEVLDALNGPLKACQFALQELIALLGPVADARNLEETPAWPLEEKAVQKTLAVVGKQKAIFHLFLAVDDTQTLAQEKALQWLSAADPSSNHHKACSKREPLTGNWLTESKAFLSWTTDANQFLMLYGIPGCGKTILCSTVIEYVQVLCGHNIKHDYAYFYFDFSDPEKRTVVGLLRSLIVQLSRQRPVLPSEVYELSEQRGNGSQQPRKEDLISTFLSLLESSERTYLILDALDECTEKESLFHLLLQMSEECCDKTALLTTSREDWEIEIALQEIASDRICIGGVTTNSDIRLHIRSCLDQDPKLKVWSNSIKEEIESKLVEGADGMFRWVFCQLEALRECSDQHALGEVLQKPVGTLDEMYDRVLANIRDEYRDKAYELLQWLAFSVRPMTVEEALEAVSVNVGSHSLSSQDRFPEWIGLSIFSSLVTMSDEASEGSERSDEASEGDGGPGEANEGIGGSGEATEGAEESCEASESLGGHFIWRCALSKLRLAHHSVKEYLVSKRILDGPSSSFFVSGTGTHRYIAEACLTYLLYFNEPNSLSQQIVEQYPLINYAARYWPSHYRAIPAEAGRTTLDTLITSLFDTSRGSSFINWVKIFDPDYDRETIVKRHHFNPDSGFCVKRDLGDEPQPLFYASMIGLLETVRWLLGRDADISARDEVIDKALGVAAANGHRDVVGLLLEGSADIDVQRERYNKVLRVAAANDQGEIVELLLQRGANANAQFGGALKAAAANGHETVVKLLLQRGADANIQEETWYIDTVLRPTNALQAAAMGGHDAVVQLLLENGADINAQGNEIGHALPVAAAAGCEPVVQLLLEKGADIDGGSGRDGKALHAASYYGQESIVRLLLEKGADIIAQAGDFGTALHAAAASRYDREAIVRLLLERGADVNAVAEQRGLFGSDGDALQAAASVGHEQIVRLLLDSGADIHAQRGLRGNALQAAASAGHEAVVLLLLERGADINAQGGYHGNALQAASHEGHDQIVQLLLEKGASPGLQGGVYSNALQAAVAAENEPAVRLLLERSTNVEVDGSWPTILHQAAFHGRESIVRLLLERGFDVKAKSVGGRTALHEAALNGHEAVVRLLLEHGAEMAAVTASGRMALHRAAWRGHAGVVQLLLEKGADIEARTVDGSTALRQAAYRGRVEVVQLLLEKGADIEAKRDSGTTALYAAALKGQELALRLLLENEANVEAKDEDGWTALHFAAAEGQEEIARLLLGKGANTGVKDDDRRTPLLQAALKGHVGVAQLLLEKGADIDARDNCQVTALHWAASYRDEAMVRLLLGEGADVDAEDIEGVAPWRYAVGEHDTVAQLLNAALPARLIRYDVIPPLRLQASQQQHPDEPDVSANTTPRH